MHVNSQLISNLIIKQLSKYHIRYPKSINYFCYQQKSTLLTNILLLQSLKMRKEIDSINKNFNAHSPRDNQPNHLESYYSPDTKSWVQKEVGANEGKNIAAKSRIGQMGGATPQPQAGFQKQQNSSPSKVGRVTSNFSRVKDKDQRDTKVFESKEDIRKSFYQKTQSKQSCCSRWWILYVVVGILTISALAGAGVYYFYLREKYFSKKQFVQVLIPKDSSQTVQSEVVSRISSLSNLFDRNLTNLKREVVNKHLTRLAS